MKSNLYKQPGLLAEIDSRDGDSDSDSTDCQTPIVPWEQASVQVRPDPFLTGLHGIPINIEDTFFWDEYGDICGS